MRSAQKDAEAFEKIPWCAKLLSDSSFVTCPTYWRLPGTASGNTLGTETFHTSRTIRKCLTQHRKSSYDNFPYTRELRSFLDLGDGLSGYPKTCHGGVIATLFDNIFGNFLDTNIQLMKHIGHDTDSMGALTASLKVQYVRPMPTPVVVLARAKLRSFDGRRIVIVGTLENGNGELYARGDAVFIQVKDQRFRNTIDSKL